MIFFVLFGVHHALFRTARFISGGVKLFFVHLILGASLWTVPTNISELLVLSQVPKLEDINLSITTREKSISIILKIDSITANMRTINGCNRTLLSDIVNLNCVVPTAGREQMLREWVEPNTEDSV